LKIPEDILRKRPSAALWPGQTDEKELGIEYYLLDTILKLLDQGFGTREVSALTDLPLEKIQKIIDRKKANIHKLAVPPICILNHNAK